MGILANARGKLAEAWLRFKAWAHSVPPDVWIGLAIAFVTLIVIWLAYRKSGGSSSTTTTSDNGTSNGNPITGPVLGSPIVANTPVVSNPVIPPPFLDWGPAKETQGIVKKITAGFKDLGGGGDKVVVPVVSQDVWNTIEGNGQQGTIAAQKAAAARLATLQNVYNTNEANGQNATIAAVKAQQLQTATVIKSATTRDESLIVKAIQPVPTSVVSSATTRDESRIVAAIKSTFTPKAPAPAPIIRPSAFAVTTIPTGRGVNVAY